MTPKEILDSIIETIINPAGEKARRSDCHKRTADYIQNHGTDDNIVIMYGDKINNYVYHSVIVDSRYNIVNDSFISKIKGEISPTDMTISYTSNYTKAKRITFTPMIAIPVKDIIKSVNKMRKNVQVL